MSRPNNLCLWVVQNGFIYQRSLCPGKLNMAWHPREAAKCVWECYESLFVSSLRSYPSISPRFSFYSWMGANKKWQIAKCCLPMHPEDLQPEDRTAKGFWGPFCSLWRTTSSLRFNWNSMERFHVSNMLYLLHIVSLFSTGTFFFFFNNFYLFTFFIHDITHVSMSFSQIDIIVTIFILLVMELKTKEVKWHITHQLNDLHSYL